MFRKLAIAVAILGTSALLVPNAEADNPADQGLFELDGDAVDVPSGTPDDWQNVCDVGPNCLDNSAASATSFVTDGNGATTFTGGGSKDDHDLGSWAHKNGSVPDKDNLSHAFAARYGNFVYFGSDRIANNGDAQIGFWFFQDEVSPLPNGKFDGEHTDGDVLVLANFSNGGTTASIEAFEWLNGGLTDLEEDGGLCTTGALNIGTCAIANTGEEDSPWPFTPKSGPANKFQRNELFEGGIDLAAVDLGGKCFASFLSETRTSTSVDSVLKDFVIGEFEQCESRTVTTPSNTTPALGDSVSDSATVYGTAAGGDPTGTVTFYVCTPDDLADLNQDTCVTGGTQLGQPVLLTGDGNAQTFTATATSASYTTVDIGRHCFRGVYGGSDDYQGSSDFSVTECFDVRDITSLETAQSWVPNDTATITATGDSNLSGSVTFTLYESANCTAGPDGDNDGKPDNLKYSASFPLTNAASPAIVTSANTVAVTSDTTVSWATTFTSTDPATASSAGHCEASQLVIDNDITD